MRGPLTRPDLDELERLNREVLRIMTAEGDASGADATVSFLGVVAYARGLEDVLNDIVGPNGYLRDKCRFDHHGYCQEHGLYESPCPVGIAQTVVSGLAKVNEEELADGHD